MALAYPTPDELRQVAAELAVETDNDFPISYVGDVLKKQDGTEGARHYLIGFLHCCIEAEEIAETMASAYLRILAYSPSRDMTVRLVN